ncbi:sugar transferase [Ekhidna sp.]|uniref:sugar transferase n=1 Tax=Ekhidna sp. TaxID=2608089 RepID=UPI0032981EE8
MPIFRRMVRGKFYVRWIKPFCDIIVALIGVIVLLPVLVVVALIVFFDTRRFPIFTQMRVGKNEQTFNLYKFRTMSLDNAEQTTTQFGKFLRSVSIDELPQLINVIKGEMSLVGPRPLLTEYLPYYNKVEKRRHEVKPGITGWAQVNGRNEIDWGKRMEMDVFYTNQISLALDLKILALTTFLIMRRDKTAYKKGGTIKFSDYASKR